MSIRFDDKGKFFTEVVAKESIPVILQTMTNRIKGNIHLRPGIRMKDQINNLETFIAVTEATVFSISGQPLYRTEFLIVNREHIVWILPENQLINPESSSGGSD